MKTLHCLLFLALISILSFSCRDDDDEPDGDTVELRESQITLSLPDEIDNSILDKLIVSNAYGDYESTLKNTIYETQIQYFNNGDLIITNVLDQSGGMVMCSMDAPFSDSGEPLEIDAEKTALTVLMTHPLLITSNKKAYDYAVSYIKNLSEFQTYKTQVYDALKDGLQNQYTPNYADLSGYKPVLMALLNGAADNSAISTPSLVRINQPVQRNNGKLTFTVTNEHKRVLHMYARKVNVNADGVTIVSEEDVVNEYGFPQIESLAPEEANYWKIAKGSLLYGDDSSPFEVTSEPIVVDIGNADKLYYDIYGLGKLSKPFNEYTQKEKNRIFLVGIHGAYNDFIKPLVNLALGVGELHDASGTDEFHYDLRYGSRTSPEMELLNSLWEALKADQSTQIKIGQSLIDKDFLKASQQLMQFCIDEILGNSQDEGLNSRYLNSLYNIVKKHTGISKTSDEFRDGLKKIANQISHVKNANFAGKVISVAELSVDVSGAIYAYFNTEIKHTIIVNREAEAYVSLLSPFPGQVFIQKGIVDLSWDFYRANVIGPIEYDLTLTVIKSDGTDQSHTWPDLTEQTLSIDLNNDINTANANNFYWKVVARKAQTTTVVAESAQYSFVVSQAIPSLTIPQIDNITENSATASAQITSPGASAINVVGFCWGTNPNPTVDGDFNGTAYSSDDYSLPIQGLQPNTIYYVRAYAQNSEGTGYGAEATFSTGSSGGTGTPGETVFVQGGTFMMGSNDGNSDEQPIHSVTLSSFQIGKYEVTNAEYAAFLNSQGNQSEGGATWYDINSFYARISQSGGSYSADAGYENHPVVEVSWYGARAYAQWVGGRLPTEAEWEYAARGGNQSQGYTYSGSNTLEDVAWFASNSGNSTHPVGTKQPNELGIYDMSGNVWEWCNDWYSGSYYGSSPSNNPQGPDSGSSRVLRGGSWSGNADGCRVAYRYGHDPNFSYDFNGFRVVFP